MDHPAVKIGIVGGGQLGRMMAQAAKKMGIYVTVSDPTPDSPAGQVADFQIVADYKDPEAIGKLAELSDVLTFEIELANDEALKKVVSSGKAVHPNPATLSIIRDKFLQKEFLKKNVIPTADFVSVQNREDIVSAGEEFGYPFLLKARTDAYDGRGNALVRNEADIDKGLEKLKGRDLYVEKFVPFVKELAVMVARTPSGEVATYPVVETRHVDNICDVVLAPAPVAESIKEKALRLAKKTIETLEGAGVFGIEMFATADDKVYINEIAPRVHNSGHYTIEANETSQFEQHIRAILDMPLGSTDMKVKAAAMKNILGERNGSGTPVGVEEAEKIPGVTVHMYGKKESRIQRKMGHIAVVGETIEECLTKAERARKMIQI